jgi:hypothetical protein
MEFNDLIKSKVKKRLKKIYIKRKKWNGAKGSFDKLSVIKRELVLIEQIMLEKLVTKL